MIAAEIFRAARAGTLATWHAEADDELLCVGVRKEIADVRTFHFACRLPSRFLYWPGQFLTFDFPIDGVTVNRRYTIASSPTRPDGISVTVKRKPDGVVSPWLHANLRPGTTVRAVGPLGDFSSIEYPGEKYLFLSGGSGVTPLMSMARAHQDGIRRREIDQGMILICCSKPLSDLVIER